MYDMYDVCVNVSGADTGGLKPLNPLYHMPIFRLCPPPADHPFWSAPVYGVCI